MQMLPKNLLIKSRERRRVGQKVRNLHPRQTLPQSQTARSPAPKRQMQNLKSNRV